jgi:uncharacterized lipoprotein YddW (UPF0748 family)
MLRRSFALTAFALGAYASPTHIARVRLPHAPDAPPAVAREFRAAWISPIWDRGFRDWPSAPGMSPDAQRAELCSLLDHAVSLGLNAVILHVRVAGDALYPTTYAPWSAALSGTSGVGPSPGYDPLAFAVAQAHARGLQLHAWFNPFRALYPGDHGPIASSHVTKQHPEWIRKYGAQTWIDPGDPVARRFVLQSMLDVVKRYDVDGVHIDDYFYPYRESRVFTRRVHHHRVHFRREIDFPDDRTWKKYGRPGGWTDRDAWRRGNIDAFIESLYKGVKAVKPSVLVGISPFGIWRSGTPAGVTGLDSFDEIYADSRHWLDEGWLDYIAPQLYWPVDGAENRFRALDAWWRTENPRGRYVWPALYTSHVYGKDPWPVDEIGEEIETIRDSRAGTNDVPGHIHFRLSALFADNSRLAATLAPLYTAVALVPAFPWLGASAPTTPVLNVVAADSTASGGAGGTGSGARSFTLAPGDSVPVRWWMIQTRGRDGKWETTLRPARGGAGGGEGPYPANAFGTSDPDEIAVTAISPTGMVSPPAIAMP